MQHRYYPLTGTREPEGVAILCIHGFVEELVVNDDPEYQVKLQFLHKRTIFFFGSGLID